MALQCFLIKSFPWNTKSQLIKQSHLKPTIPLQEPKLQFLKQFNDTLKSKQAQELAKFKEAGILILKAQAVAREAKPVNLICRNIQVSKSLGYFLTNTQKSQFLLYLFLIDFKTVYFSTKSLIFSKTFIWTSRLYLHPFTFRPIFCPTLLRVFRILGPKLKILKKVMAKQKTILKWVSR